MLTLRFDVMDDFFGGAHVAAPLKRRAAAAASVTPCAASECCAAVCCGAASTALEDGGAGRRRLETEGGADPAGEPQLGGGAGPFDGAALDEDFDLGPPPPSGPVLVRQRAMDWTVEREAKAAALARKLEPAGAAAALRSARLIPPATRGRFAGV